jgi:hypothetical protein
LWNLDTVVRNVGESLKWLAALGGGQLLRAT